MEEIDPQYSNRRIKIPNFASHFERGEKKIRVCKVFFVSTLGITNHCIRSFIIKRDEGDSDDRRGQHVKQNQVPENVKLAVRAHIGLIPKIKSYHTRAHSEKDYFEKKKDYSTELYMDYKHLRQTEGKAFASLAMYRNLFNYEFNLVFFVSKKTSIRSLFPMDMQALKKKKGN